MKKAKSLKRAFFHYEQLEEFQVGMWKIVRGEKRKQNACAAANLMRDSIAFYAAMKRATTEWPRSCMHNLTAESTNRIAWLGHAGNCLGVGSPEENTRIGWHMLNRDEQNEANRTAERVLNEWIAIYPGAIQLELELWH